MRRAALMTLTAVILSTQPTTAADGYRVCGHVPITGATAQSRHPDRFGQFYFDYVNAEFGGIDGHPVTFTVFDDRYSPAGARDSAERCVALGAQLLVGLSGADQMGAVSGWAAGRGVPYLRGGGPLSILDSDQLATTALISPSDEQMMTGLAASLVRAADKAPVFGIVRVDAAASRPARDAFAAELAVYGHRLAVDVPVQKDETQYANTWKALFDAEVTHVTLHISLSAALKMLAQKPPTYAPTFSTIVVELATEGLARIAPDITLYALHDPAPLYDPDDAALAWYEEMQTFRRLFERYSREQVPGPDWLDWESYLRAKQVARFLDALDEDLSPEHIVSQFDSYSEAADDAFPTCALDFSERPHLGAHAWHVLRLSRAGLEQIAFCVGAAGVDLSGPDAVCSRVVAAGAIRCRASDHGSLVAGLEVRARALEGREWAIARGFTPCRDGGTIRLRLPPGLYHVEAVAQNCDGVAARTTMQVLVGPG